MRGSFGRIQADISFTLTINEELSMNVLIPGIFRVPIKVSVIHFQLKVCMSAKITERLTSGRNR
jgi:hypothetical protein